MDEPQTDQEDIGSVVTGARRATASALALPFLVAMAPVLSVWSRNAAEVSVDVATPVILTVGVVTAIFVAVLWIATSDLERSALTAAVLAVPLMTYGYQLDALPQSSTEVALALGVANLGLSVAALAVVWRKTIVAVSRFTLMAAVVFTALSLPPIISSSLREIGAIRGPTVAPSDLPDVYFIVLDGYGRNDVLAERYGLDNSSFLGKLRDRGFYVAVDSYSNYAFTYLSLASTLNMRYLPDEAPYDGIRMDEWIADASVIHDYQAAGYQYVFFETPWFGTDAAPLSDVTYRPADGATRFAQVITRASIPGRLLARPDGHVAVINAFDQLPDVAEIDGPTFTFMHALVPHPPFMFHADGSVREPYIGDLNSLFEREPYAEQVTYVNELVEQVIDEILAASDQPPIIVIQGDHGPLNSLDGDTAEEVWWERHAILNAVFAPAHVQQDLYPSISPVNTFRVLQTVHTRRKPMLLPDRSYFNWYYEAESPAIDDYDPRALRDVTDALP